MQVQKLLPYKSFSNPLIVKVITITRADEVAYQPYRFALATCLCASLACPVTSLQNTKNVFATGW